jgi:hypothetical protein
MKRYLCVAAALAASSLSMAQLETPTNLGVRLGFAYPIDASTRDMIPNFLGAGLDIYLTKSLLPGKNTESSLSLDWFGKSGSGTKGNMFPLLVNQRWYFGDMSAVAGDGRNYYFGGLGVAIMDITTTKTVFAARVGLGREFNANIFGEATLYYTEPAEKLRGSSLGFHIGYRF